MSNTLIFATLFASVNSYMFTFRAEQVGPSHDEENVAAQIINNISYAKDYLLHSNNSAFQIITR